MGRLTIHFTLLGLLAALPAHAQQPRMNVFAIHTDFVTSDVAQTKCLKPSADDLKNFKANYMMVRAAAEKALGQKMPTATPEQVHSVMLVRVGSEYRAAQSVIKDCNAQLVRAQIQRFKVQASPSLFNPARTRAR